MHALYTYIRPLCFTIRGICLHGPFTPPKPSAIILLTSSSSYFFVCFVRPLLCVGERRIRKQSARKWQYFAAIPGTGACKENVLEKCSLTIAWPWWYIVPGISEPLLIVFYRFPQHSRNKMPKNSKTICQISCPKHSPYVPYEWLFFLSMGISIVAKFWWT